jgi:type II secretory pathway component PulF
MLRTSLRLMIFGWAWGLLLVLLGLVVPRLERIFKDFGVPLPRLTTHLFNGWHRGWIWLPLVFFLVEVYRFVLGREADSDRSPASRPCSALPLLIPFLLIGFVLLALALPFFTIMPRLTG